VKLAITITAFVDAMYQPFRILPYYRNYSYSVNHATCMLYVPGIAIAIVLHRTMHNKLSKLGWLGCRCRFVYAWYWYYQLNAPISGSISKYYWNLNLFSFSFWAFAFAPLLFDNKSWVCNSNNNVVFVNISSYYYDESNIHVL
jgi:hypothetical protein